MNRIRLNLHHVSLAILALLGTVTFAHSQSTDDPKKTVIPLIVMDEVPLLDAIKNLARQANINYIIDPQVGYAPAESKVVSVRWQNVTAEQALNHVLTSNSLTLVENPATTVARIASEKKNAKPVDPQLLSNDTSSVIPLIVMDEVPLTDVIRNLARQANIEYMLDPNIPYGRPGPDGKLVPQPMVSVRWLKVTPKQALVAVLDNYNLTMTVDAASITRIGPKK